jgi:hypothetical protein
METSNKEHDGGNLMQKAKYSKQVNFLNFIILLKGVLSCKIHNKNNRNLGKCLQANLVFSS